MSAAPLKILAVDKEQLLLCALERASKGRPFEIKTAATPEEALQEVDLCRFDLFLLELDLHYQQSLALLKTIDERCPYVPIIVMTCSSMNSDELKDIIRAIRKHGVWHLLEKPFRLDKMLKFISVIFQEYEYDVHGSNSISHNYDNENRDQFRRPHVQPIQFSYKTIEDGESVRVSTKGILTDISEFGSGILANVPIQPSQVISFEDEFVKKNGIVAWSMMLGDDTCRFGVQFC